MGLYLRADNMPRFGRSDDAMNLELTVRDHMISYLPISRRRRSRWWLMSPIPARRA